MLRAMRSLFAPRGSLPGEVPLGNTLAPAAPLTGVAANVEQEVRSWLSQGKPVQALRAAQRARADSPAVPGLAFLHGLSLEHVGRHEEALEAYRAELALNPGHAEARVRCQHLEAALAAPATVRIPIEQRSWHTSLPRPTLLGLQKSLHNYKYRGIPLLKNPFDLALYPRLLWKLKPRTIVEIGSKSGGSGLWLGDLLTSFGIDGHVYSVDIVKVEAISHARVTFLEGDGRALGETLSTDLLLGLPRPWLVIEDADHAYETSSAVLRFFDPWLRPEEYIVVEDGIISDLSEIADCNSGPHRALKEFLAQHRGEYDIDADYCDFFGYNLTWCTNGFLRKLGNAKGIVSAVPGHSEPQSHVGAALASRVGPPPSGSTKVENQRLLNLGCGTSFHPAWTNVDVAPMDPAIKQHDLRTRLPFKAGEFHAVYHSHVLEHLPHSEALPFLRECHRVLAPGGILRAVVPDLETIARLYLNYLDGGLAGDLQAARCYDWVVLELLDQMVREQSGGEMLKYWQQNPMPAEEFVLERMGAEVRKVLAAIRALSAPAAARSVSAPLNPMEVGRFRQSGEVHKWMYDRLSLRVLLQQVGFSDIRVCAANESRIPRFNSFLLDLAENGSTRKPDSLFMEAIKPSNI